jgi:hypothetical protein
MWPGCASRIETAGGLSRYLVFQVSVPARRVAWEADLSLAPTARRTRRVNFLEPLLAFRYSGYYYPRLAVAGARSMDGEGGGTDAVDLLLAAPIAF